MLGVELQPDTRPALSFATAHPNMLHLAAGASNFCTCIKSRGSGLRHWPRFAQFWSASRGTCWKRLRFRRNSRPHKLPHRSSQTTYQKRQHRPLDAIVPNCRLAHRAVLRLLEIKRFRPRAALGKLHRSGKKSDEWQLRVVVATLQMSQTAHSRHPHPGKPRRRLTIRP